MRVDGKGKLGTWKNEWKKILANFHSWRIDTGNVQIDVFVALKALPLDSLHTGIPRCCRQPKEEKNTVSKRFICVYYNIDIGNQKAANMKTPQWNGDRQSNTEKYETAHRKSFFYLRYILSSAALCVCWSMLQITFICVCECIVASFELWLCAFNFIDLGYESVYVHAIEIALSASMRFLLRSNRARETRNPLR